MRYRGVRRWTHSSIVGGPISRRLHWPQPGEPGVREDDGMLHVRHRPLELGAVRRDDMAAYAAARAVEAALVLELPDAI